MQPINLYPHETRATLSLASIFAVRMLGLFMVLPILSLYAHSFSDTTPLLIGLAMGSYGLTQACLQLPFAMLSDKFERKWIITIGLSLFIIGSLVCAQATTLTGLVFGRALQGAGAISSTLMALMADLTREESRTKAMAILGSTIGLAFMAAMFFGPLLNSIIGIHGLFMLTALLGGIGIAVLFTCVPTPKYSVFHREVQPLPTLLKHNLRQPELLRLHAGIFCLHAILTALFVVIPIIITDTLSTTSTEQWRLYLPVLLAAFISMLPFIIIAEKKRQMKPVFIGAIAMLCVSQIVLWQWHTYYSGMCFGLYIFFTAFTLLEASLPSLVSKLAPAGSKGTAMGIYASAQFLGIFVGGSLGGLLYGHYHTTAVFLMTLTMAWLWLVIAIRMCPIPYVATFMLNVGKMSSAQADTLTQSLLCMPGVADAIVIATDGIAYLKIDNARVNHSQLLALSQNTIH